MGEAREETQADWTRWMERGEIQLSRRSGKRRVSERRWSPIDEGAQCRSCRATASPAACLGVHPVAGGRLAAALRKKDFSSGKQSAVRSASPVRGEQKASTEAHQAGDHADTPGDSAGYAPLSRSLHGRRWSANGCAVENFSDRRTPQGEAREGMQQGHQRRTSSMYHSTTRLFV